MKDNKGIQTKIDSINIKLREIDFEDIDFKDIEMTQKQEQSFTLSEEKKRSIDILISSNTPVSIICAALNISEDDLNAYLQEKKKEMKKSTLPRNKNALLFFILYSLISIIFLSSIALFDDFSIDKSSFDSSSSLSTFCTKTSLLL